MELGTYTTIDTPCLAGQGAGIPPSQEQIILMTKANVWLKEKFAEIGGRVWVKHNAHDFGTYPSFEIDTPDWYELTSLNQDFEDDDTDLAGDRERLDEWNEKAEEIETQYSEIFSEWL